MRCQLKHIIFFRQARRPTYRGGTGVSPVYDINEHDKIDLVMNFNF